MENFDTAIFIYKTKKDQTHSESEKFELIGLIADCYISISECLNYIENFKDSLIELDRAIDVLLEGPDNKI